MSKKKASIQPSFTRASAVWGLGAICLFGVALMLYFMPRQPLAAQDYPIQGFDVSHHQQNIQWHLISAQKYRFVYLKATEGGDYQDPKFHDYWLKARERGLLVGAYHFYRLCREGEIQAQNFIHTVPVKADALPPVIDLEYDSACIAHFNKQQLLAQIAKMHDLLQQHYGKAPIFYTSKAFYNIVLAGEFSSTPLWMREYKTQPQLKDPATWLFWQYSHRGKIKGIATQVDLNAFNGNEQDWAKFLQKNGISPLTTTTTPSPVHR